MKIAGEIRAGFEHFWGLIYPRTCVITGERLPEGKSVWITPRLLKDVSPLEEPFCGRCGMPFSASVSGPFVCSNCVDLEFAFEAARAAYRSRSVVRDLIHRYKYRQQPWLEEMLADWLHEGYQRHYQGMRFSALIPVPLYRTRERQRGFNQAHQLTQSLSRLTGIPVCTRLKRVRDTGSQVSLDRDDRLGNLRQAFVWKGDKPCPGPDPVLLIDDVFTTGATAHECARVLRQNGAQKVFVLTVARA